MFLTEYRHPFNALKCVRIPHVPRKIGRLCGTPPSVAIPVLEVHFCLSTVFYLRFIATEAYSPHERRNLANREQKIPIPKQSPHLTCETLSGVFLLGTGLVPI